METIIAAVVGIVAGGVISVFGTDIRHFLSSLTKKDYIIARWRVKWTTEKDGEIIEDDVNIQSCVKGFFRGEGHNDGFGKYYISGYRTESSIAFTFSGHGAKEQLLGSATLDGRGIMENKLEGVWSNIAVTGELFYGSVIMEKINA